MIYYRFIIIPLLSITLGHILAYGELAKLFCIYLNETVQKENSLNARYIQILVKKYISKMGKTRYVPAYL